jgi:hypothetical protein
MEGTTRISDLPENSPMQFTNNFTRKNDQDMSAINTNYVPINIHPNPYGISDQNPIMPMPEQPNMQQMKQVQQLEQISITQRNQSSEQQEYQRYQEQVQTQQNELKQIPHIRLPSRDVRMDTTQYTNDEEVQANYIPRPKLTKDYILDYEEENEVKTLKHDKNKKRENLIDTILSEIQVPIFIAVLYFLFQLPIINTLVFKRFSFLSIYSEDGNFNTLGLALKSMLFANMFYSVQKIAKFISEF